MERKRSIGNKILIFLNHLGFIGLMICIVMLFYESTYQGFSITYMLDDTNKTESFEETDIFTDIMEQYIQNALKYTVIRGQFETNAIFDGQKEVDIAQYALHKGDTSEVKKSVSYYLEDLIKMGKIGLIQKPITIDRYREAYDKAFEEYFSDYYEGSQLSDEDYKLWISGNYSGTNVQIETVPAEVPETEAVQDEATGEINAEVSEETNIAITEEPQLQADVLYFGNSETVKTPYIVVLLEEDDEAIRPSDGKRLILHTTSIDEYVEYSKYLIDAIDMAYTNYLFYEELETKLSETNFKYYITYQKAGKNYVFTNFLDNTAMSENDITQAFVDNGKYIKIDYDGFVTQSITNTELQKDIIISDIDKYAYAYPSSETKIWFGVDTTYAKSDEFSMEKMEYVSDFKNFRSVFTVAIFLFFWLMFSYMVLAMKEKGNEMWRPPLIDRIKTELAAVITALLTALGTILTFFAVYNYLIEADYETLISTKLYAVVADLIVGVGALIVSVILQAFYLSLIRRIKDHALWSNSLLRMFCIAVHGIFYHPKAFVRTWIPYMLFLFINALSFVLANRFKSLLPVILMFLIDLSIGGMLYKNNRDLILVLNGIKEIEKGDLEYKVDTNELKGDNLQMADAVNELGISIKTAVEASVKDERMKTDLITNVSHDIKTPLTSIINYIDLIKREKVDNSKINEYVKVLETKSQRLKQLTDDLVEASKISSGNIDLQIEKLDLSQMIQQSLGEFDERFEEQSLEVIVNLPEKPAFILADSRRMWRVIENLYSNICKYALHHTRVYIDLVEEDNIVLTIKNISNQKLNINAKELTERFIRGDISRSTEGSGLGLSIASSLTELQKGQFDIALDGDLFKIIIQFTKA